VATDCSINIQGDLKRMMNKTVEIKLLILHYSYKKSKYRNRSEWKEM
jgi:hypothetical protein